MPEHTPAPTPARSIYGFALFIAFKTLFVLYLCWAIIPDEWLNVMNIYYYPQKYWAVAVPIQMLTALTLFAFFVYPGLNLLMTPHIDDLSTITDNFALKKRSACVDNTEGTVCDCKTEQCLLKRCEQTCENFNESRVPPAEDLEISDVCRLLYYRCK